MSFLRLWPLVLLISIPLLILLYMLKRKTREVTVSSTLLWDEVYKNTQASTPWEKFKNNIMLILQIIILVSIILALINPFLNFGGGKYKNVILVIDNTASMSAAYEGSTRLHKAKEIAKEYITSSKEGTKSYLILSNKDSTLELTGEEDKSSMIDKIDGIKQSYLNGNINDSLSLVKSIGEGIGEEYEALFITDKDIDIGNINGKVVSLSNSGINGSIDSISHKKTEEGMKVIANITNSGQGDYSSDFSLYGEKELLDVQSISLKSGESKTLYFDINDFKGEYFKGELSSKDLIEKDNIYYDIIKGAETRKILLVTQGNVFLEKALTTYPNIELFKTNDSSNINNKDNYDLYIFDNEDPEVMPDKGNILFLNSSSNKYFKLLEGYEGGEVKGVKDSMSKYLNNLSFVISKYKELEIPYWGRKILQVEDKSVGFLGDKDGQIIGSLGFDFHNSDFPLKSEFPVFIHYLSGALLNSGMVSKNNFDGGEEILIKGSGLSDNVKIKTPEGKINEFKGGEYKDWKDIGVYTIQVKNEDEVEKEIISINYPVKDESNIDLGEISEQDNIKTSKGIKKGMNLLPYFIILTLVVVSIEWYLYRKGY